MTGTPTSSIRIDLPSGTTRGYDILIGKGLIDLAGQEIASRLGQRTCLIVTDSNVAPLYLARVEKAIKTAGHTLMDSLLVPAGEKSKSLPTLASVWSAFAERGADRKTLIIALGGGVIGDLAGFAAASYMRGIDFVQFPTTLLAQVDSSVGGKTGINADFGKNTIGAFHQPRLVLADIGTLESLPHREILAGYAEIVKYGLIMDTSFFDWCEANGKALIDGNDALRIHAIRQSCAHKAALVIEDEMEAGRRALLNMGHTFGHALESATGFSDRLLHGEAVAIGTAMAFRLSAALDLCPSSHADRVAKHLRAVGLPLFPPDQPYDIDSLILAMKADKKAEEGTLTLILAQGIGQGLVVKKADPASVRKIWAEWLAQKTP